MTMISPVPNVPDHQWYQKRNHIRIPQTAECKAFLDASVVGGAGDPGGLVPKIQALFSAGQQGCWYDALDLTTMFQDSAGVTPVTAVGQPIGLLKDKSGRGNNALQATAAARPTYAGPPFRILYDKVDDLLTVTVPAGGWVGTMVMGTNAGTLAYDVNVPAGTYTVGAINGLYFAGNALHGLIIRNGILSAAEIADCKAYMTSNGAGVDYSTNANFNHFWRLRTEITGLFPVFDASLATIISNLCNATAGFTTFPAIRFPATVTACANGFFGCTNLANFPSHAFDLCSLCTNYSSAFSRCALTQQSVNDILVSIDTAGALTGTLHIDQGTSAPPTGVGLTAKNNLIAKGWTVVTN